jgi:hypothetical protein
MNFKLGGAHPSSIGGSRGAEVILGYKCAVSDFYEIFRVFVKSNSKTFLLFKNFVGKAPFRRS